jgi:NAD+ diphosphatase
MIPFSGNDLNRMSEKRTDAQWIEAKLRDPSSRIFPMWKLQPFLLGPENADPPYELGFFKPEAIDVIAGEGTICIFLGVDGDRALFALEIPDEKDPTKDGPLARLGFFRDARLAGQMVPIRDSGIIAQAKAMIDWHQRHGFCPKCGTRTKIMDAGYRRLCDKCNSEHFPRVDPVVIMLATHGEACLVGRGKLFPQGMFSALAGFIEPGETIEEAVRRELMEEASVKVGEVSYYATQPWPFPSSLMIGCFAKAESRDFKADETELAEVRWIERKVARDLIEGKRIDGIMVPPSVAIAHHLIKAFALGER